MAINLITQFLPYSDEMFASESKKSLLTNDDFKWTGAHTVKVYKIGTSKMSDYNRNPASGFTGSRYGDVGDLDAATEEFTLKKDRSFTFAIDKLDSDETGHQLAAASALARQQRQVVMPEVDTYTYGVMCENAGHNIKGLLTPENIYDEIIRANNALDNAEVPETDRILVVPPDIYTMMKKCRHIVMETDISNELRIKGVIAMIDGAKVIKVPAVRLPQNFGFMLAHPCATVAPTKLEDYKIHEDPPGISGSLVEGRICYDAFVLDNKVKAIYYHEQATGEQTDESMMDELMMDDPEVNYPAEEE